MDILKLGKQRAKELGLKRLDMYGDPVRDKTYSSYYNDDDIHKLLGEGTIVFNQEKALTIWSKDPYNEYCQALLIGIKSIVQDTAESLLREFITESEDGIWSCSLLTRAKALLEKP